MVSDLLPIDDIEVDANATALDDDIVPEPLVDDPDIGDGSSSRIGYSVASWRLHTLRRDSLVGMTDYEGDDWASRSARRAQEASRNARTKEEREARKMRRVKVGGVLVAILAIVGIVGATYAMEVWGGKSVPNVQGFTQVNAVQIIEDKGFVVALKAAPTDSLEGRVVESTPEAGTRIDAGSTVTLVIGQQRVLPDVVGKTEAEAREALEAVGAQNIRTETRVVFDEDEGLVHEMRPAPESVFMSTEEIVLVISQLPRVPDVMDMDETSAIKAMKDAEIPAHVTYEQSDVEDRLKILRTEPAVGERIEAGQEVNIVVGDPLISVMRLSDYFDASMPHIRTYLESEGYTLKVAAKGQDNHLVARFDSSEDVQLSFQWKPWTREAEKARGIADVLGADASVEGVRLSMNVNRSTRTSTSTSSQQGKQYVGATTPKCLDLLGIDYAYIDDSTAYAVMEMCGFDGILGSCTQDTIRLPEGSASTGHTFYCCYGEAGDYIWTVLVAGSGERAAEASRIVTTCVPKTFFQTSNVDGEVMAIADYAAYTDEYVA